MCLSRHKTASGLPSKRLACENQAIDAAKLAAWPGVSFPSLLSRYSWIAQSDDNTGPAMASFPGMRTDLPAR
jgi:hypothetical protein